MHENGKAADSMLSIGALAKQTGCKVETIRYYERIGLMPPPPRTPAGRRLFDDSHVRRLSFVRRSRELGFALEKVRTLLKLVDGGHYTCEEVQSITLNHIADLRCRISDLEKLAGTLEQMAGECSGGTIPECPIVDALLRQ